MVQGCRRMPTVMPGCGLPGMTRAPSHHVCWPHHGLHGHSNPSETTAPTHARGIWRRFFCWVMRQRPYTQASALHAYLSQGTGAPPTPCIHPSAKLHPHDWLEVYGGQVAKTTREMRQGGKVAAPDRKTRIEGKPVIWCSLQRSTSVVQSTCNFRTSQNEGHASNTTHAPKLLTSTFSCMSACVHMATRDTNLDWRHSFMLMLMLMLVLVFACHVSCLWLANVDWQFAHARLHCHPFWKTDKTTSKQPATHLGDPESAVTIRVLGVHLLSHSLPCGLQSLAPGAPGCIKIHHHCRHEQHSVKTPSVALPFNTLVSLWDLYLPKPGWVQSSLSYLDSARNLQVTSVQASLKTKTCQRDT